MKTIIAVRTDKNTKDQANEIAKNLGIPLSTIMNAYLLQFIRDKKIAFSSYPQLSPQGQQKLDQALADNKIVEFDSNQDMLDYANKSE